MKTLVTLVSAVLFLTPCNGQSGAINDQKEIYKALNDMIAKGMVATSDVGYTMTATIDGKPWKAQAMYPISMNGSIHGCYLESTIDLPYWEGYNPGSKTDFSKGHGPLFAPPGPFDLYTVHAGQLNITKVTPEWLEGTFYFTATSQSDPAKKIEVTNGF